jgi:hypothetical protein
VPVSGYPCLDDRVMDFCPSWSEMVGRHKKDGVDWSGPTQPLDNLRPLTASLYMQQQLWERIYTDMGGKTEQHQAK